MVYEIPQQLEYKEKIMFGLTFKQLAYALLFAPFIAFLFFKTSLPFYLKMFFSINLSGLAVGFIFLDLDKHLKNWTIWLRSRKIVKPEKRAQLIPIKEIKNNIIINKKGKKIAVLKITPINFSIKPENVKETISAMFQKFLNSLDFPVQIVMNTETLDLRDYLTEVDKKIQQNKLFAELFTKYKEHLEAITQQNKVMNRNFYLVIPEKNDIEIQLQLCKNKLESIGLRTSRVLNAELSKLTNHFFECVEEDGSLIPPTIENTPSYVKVGTTFHRTIAAYGYPRTVEAGFLDKIVSSSGNFDLSIHIEPYDIETMMVDINKELQKQRADLFSAKSKGILNPSLEIKYKDTKGVLTNLQKGVEKLFNVGLYINCRAASKAELDLLTRKVESELNALLIIPKQPSFRMLQALQSCAPLAMNHLKIRRNVPTGALSAFFPFTSSFLQADANGIWFGLNKNNIPIIKDIFSLSNPNGFCLASSGSGKSYMAKLFIARHLMNGTKVMVIDPQGEYRGLVERFKGQRIDLSRSSNTIINPLDLMGHEYAEKRLALMDLMPLMLGELTEPQKSFIDVALTTAYENCGITNNPETWNNKPPILEDILRVLTSMERKASSLEKMTIRSISNRLRMYVDGVFSFLNKQTTINFNNRFVCFDIGSLPKQVKPVMMFLVLDYVYMKMKSDLERKLLVIDEAWSILSRAEEASYIFEIVKTCRKFNLALFLINQEVEGLLTSEAGKSVLANSSYTLLMRQKPAVIKSIQNTFSLSETERMFLLTAAVGEGLLILDDEHSEIRIVASEEEHAVITTNADERLSQQKTNPQDHVQKQKSVSITVDSDKRFYLSRNVSKDNRDYLLSKGYVLAAHKNIHGKKESYLLKKRANENMEHFFLTFDIAEYLKTLTDQVYLYETTKPDIVFELKGKRYAIEVETGKTLQTFRKQLDEKIAVLNEEYEKRWCFVVTNENFAPTYNTLGKTFTRTTFLKQFSKWIKKV